MTEQQQRELAKGLKALADSTREMNSSPHVEAAVLAKMGSVNGITVATSVPPTHRLIPLAAALVLAVGGALWTARSMPAHPAIRPSGFMALPGAAWLPEMESATIVRVSLPVTALPAYGVAIQPDVTSEAVLAELLVAQDGQARAIRFVNDSD